jgi:aryl-alcohol dehydrogenase-like predicted oxidoreductase
MRFRPFGATGKTVSAVSLALRAQALSSAEAWRGLIFTGMENGINCFDLESGSAEPAQGMGAALQAVERRLLFLVWTLRGEAGRPLTAQAIAASVRDGLKQTGAKYFDVLMLDDAAFSTLTSDAPSYLEQLREAHFIHHFGVRGDGPVLDTAIGHGVFDVLATPYNLMSEWATRRRLREAAERGMVSIAYDAAPADIVAPPKPAAPRLLPLRRDAKTLAGVGTYAFLHETPGWSPEELCLAYALTEPSLATVQVEHVATDRIEAVAKVPERDTPTALGAQIEMARFCGESPGEQRRA